MNKKLYYLFFALALVSCERPAIENTAQLKLMLKAEGISRISDVSVTAHDINMNRDYTDTTLTMTLPLGYYDLAVTAKGDGQPITAYKRGVSLSQDCAVELVADFVRAGDDHLYWRRFSIPEQKRRKASVITAISTSSLSTIPQIRFPRMV